MTTFLDRRGLARDLCSSLLVSLKERIISNYNQYFQRKREIERDWVKNHEEKECVCERERGRERERERKRLGNGY